MKEELTIEVRVDLKARICRVSEAFEKFSPFDLVLSDDLLSKTWMKLGEIVDRVHQMSSLINIYMDDISPASVLPAPDSVVLVHSEDFQELSNRKSEDWNLYTIDGQISADGKVLQAMTESRINEVLRNIYRLKPALIIIVLKNSTGNSVHEKSLIHLLNTAGYKNVLASHRLTDIFSMIPFFREAGAIDMINSLKNAFASVNSLAPGINCRVMFHF